MQQFDLQLELKPTFETCKTIVEADILNKLADNELLNFQSKNEFLWKHPLASQKKMEMDSIEEMKKLKTHNPLKFINEITNITQNIRRIESNIRNKKFKDPQTLQSWEENLMRAKMKLNILTDLLK